MRLADFHPWIAKRAEPLFADGHYRSAVVAATQFLEAGWKIAARRRGAYPSASWPRCPSTAEVRPETSRDCVFRGYGSRDSLAWKKRA